MVWLQAERLSDFYEVCKGLDLARSFQFPTLEQVWDEAWTGFVKWLFLWARCVLTWLIPRVRWQ